MRVKRQTERQRKRWALARLFLFILDTCVLLALAALLVWLRR
jgi:hypothetical protein